MGLTILETVANPYTTVLCPKEFAATRINFAQSFNGSGWIFGPVIGGAIMPKLMGYLGDVYNLSVGFIVPLACFAIVSLYGFTWPKLSRATR